MVDISIWKAWIISLRLQTLPLSCCGILLGTTLATTVGVILDYTVFALTLITAISLQLLANLANDYGDFSKNTDNDTRLGPRRGMQLGLISPAQMRLALWLTGVFCLASGSVLLMVACNSGQEVMVFLVLGAVSVAASLAYTLGRYAYGYYGLGDLSVLLFFGFVAVGGSYYLQVGRLDADIVIPAIGTGLLSVAVLNVNNMRDINEDGQHGKITFVVWMGLRCARYYHLSIILAGLVALAWTAWHFSHGELALWIFALSLPLFAPHILTVLRSHCPQMLRAQLPVVVRLNVLAVSALALGLIFDCV